MVTFWIAAALLSALAALPILMGAARGSNPAVDADDPTLVLHQRQLTEIDVLAGRGLLSDAERASARAEAGRRLIAAAETAPPTAAATSPLPRKLAVAGAIAAPLVGLAIYAAVGSPSAPDQPFERRLAAWTEAAKTTDGSTLRPPELAAAVEALAREHPKDPELPRALANLRLSMEDVGGASTAMRKAVTLAPQRPDLWTELGQIQTAEAEGEVSDDAAFSFRRALALDPSLPLPRYLLARRQIADGQVAEGLAAWRALAAELPAEGRAMMDRQIAEVAAKGRLPDAQAETAAAQPQVGPEQIAAMVAGLAERLKAQPDDPQGWMRLVRAYTVMGETAKRDAALAEARTRYKNDPEVLRGLDSAAQVPQQ